MKLIARSMLVVFSATVLLSTVGCGGPDNSAAPGFNKESASNPGSIKMEPLTKPKGAK